MPPPAKRVKVTTLRRESPEVAKLCFRLIAETDAHYVGDSRPSCFVLFSCYIKSDAILLIKGWQHVVSESLAFNVSHGT